MAADAPNVTLSQLLAGVSWSGERLVREICRVLGWPSTVQALVSSRLAYGYALAGDAERFHAVHGRARELVDHRPRWAYWVSPQSMDHVCGFQQVSLGIADSRNSRGHLGNPVSLLTPRASAGTSQLYQCDALLDGIALARACAALRASSAPARPTPMSASSPPN